MYLIQLTIKITSIRIFDANLMISLNSCNYMAWRIITIVIKYVAGRNITVLKEGRRQTFPLSMSLAQKPPNISN
jgi:ABC-type cobalamin/Fe3+-siderophores transport system ATPase subunit